MTQSLIYFYEGTYQFTSKDVATETAKEVAEKVLNNQYSFRKTNDVLWCEVITGEVCQRYTFDIKNLSINEGICFNIKTFKRYDI